jgi:predicted Zn-dependent protease
MGEQGKMTPWVIGSLILGVLAASKSAQGAQALIVGGQAAAVQSQLSYSRDMEREADRVGYGVMSDAGYDPQGFVGMFAKLQQAAGLNDNGAYPYLRSHPLTTERIADMQGRLQLNTAPARTMPDVEQAMLAARARVLSQGNVDALRAATNTSPATLPQATIASKSGVWYAATLAHIQLRDFAAAERSLQNLDRLVNEQTAAMRLSRLLRAELAAAQGRFQAVLPLLASQNGSALQRPELMATAHALVRLPATPARAEVLRQLREQVQAYPLDAEAWNTLANLCAAQGQVLQSLRAEGEAQMARMDWQGAIDRFRAAQDWAKTHQLQAGDHIEASIVDTRLRHAQALMREAQTER